jgi:hypothetical protein
VFAQLVLALVFKTRESLASSPVENGLCDAARFPACRPLVAACFRPTGSGRSPFPSWPQPSPLLRPLVRDASKCRSRAFGRFPLPLPGLRRASPPSRPSPAFFRRLREGGGPPPAGRPLARASRPARQRRPRPTGLLVANIARLRRHLASRSDHRRPRRQRRNPNSASNGGHWLPKFGSEALGKVNAVWQWLKDVCRYNERRSYRGRMAIVAWPFSPIACRLSLLKT